MPPGRLAKIRPLSRPREEMLRLAAKARKSLSEAKNPDEETRTFLLELVTQYMSLSERSKATVDRLLANIKADPSLSLVSKDTMEWALQDWNIEDSASRMQIRTLVIGAMTGKPPEAPKHRGAFVRHVPGGGTITTPNVPKDGLDLS